MKEILKQLNELDHINFAERIETLNTLRAQHGDLVYEALKQHVSEQVIDEWRQLKRLHPRHTAEELVEIQWEHVSRSAGIEFEVTHEDQVIHVKTHHCPLADMASELSATEWGYYYYCYRSKYAVASFCDNVTFKRSQTLMQGHHICDHQYIKNK